MGRRIDFYDDPDAPEANSLVPSVNVVVSNPAGEVLLIRRSDNDNWAVPGGAIDLGESRRTERLTGVASAVANVDLGQAVGHLDVLAVRADCHIAEGQRVGQLSGRLGDRKSVV